MEMTSPCADGIRRIAAARGGWHDCNPIQGYLDAPEACIEARGRLPGNCTVQHGSSACQATFEITHLDQGVYPDEVPPFVSPDQDYIRLCYWSPDDGGRCVPESLTSDCRLMPDSTVSDLVSNACDEAVYSRSTNLATESPPSQCSYLNDEASCDASFTASLAIDPLDPMAPFNVSICHWTRIITPQTVYYECRALTPGWCSAPPPSMPPSPPLAPPSPARPPWHPWAILVDGDTDNSIVPAIDIYVHSGDTINVSMMYQGNTTVNGMVPPASGALFVGCYVDAGSCTLTYSLAEGSTCSPVFGEVEANATELHGPPTVTRTLGRSGGTTSSCASGCALAAAAWIGSRSRGLPRGAWPASQTASCRGWTRASSPSMSPRLLTARRLIYHMSKSCSGLTEQEIHGGLSSPAD